MATDARLHAVPQQTHALLGGFIAWSLSWADNVSHGCHTHIPQGANGKWKWPLHSLFQGRVDSRDACRLTPTIDITIAAVIAQEITPALSPAPYDWLATAAICSHTACSHLCALRIESTCRGAIELYTGFSWFLTCVEGRPHTKEEIPAQIEELQ